MMNALFAGPARNAAVLSLAMLFSACNQVPATNPFDPDTPEQQQATGRIVGTLEIAGIESLGDEAYLITVRDARGTLS